MRDALNAVLDRRLEQLIVARARRRAPVLQLVPARWIVVATKPMVPRLRRSLSRYVLAVGAAVALVLAVLLPLAG